MYSNDNILSIKKIYIFCETFGGLLVQADSLPTEGLRVLRLGMSSAA